MGITGRIRSALVIAVWAAACARLPGGGWWQTDTFPAPSLNPPPLANPILSDREKVYARPPGPHHTARAGILIFRSPPQLPEVGGAMTQIFYRNLLEKRPFLETVLIPEPYGSLSDGVLKGRAYKVDLVVLGEVPYFLDGGGVGRSGLQVDLKVVEVRTGRLLWQMADSVAATPRPILDLWITETRPRPTPSICALAEGLAARLCETLKETDQQRHKE
uniref:Lipoprotein n=1 Tax=Desulfobacca acetoxidans TaxID=60893 RepID=A0A7C3SJK0_9BACT